jgi:hypothetical protein
MTTWKWIHHDGERLRDVGILADGSLHNPNGYPEEIVRAAVRSADDRRHQRRSEAAKRAAVTRHERQERKVYQLVEKLSAGGALEPCSHCAVCGKSLDDTDSIQRGIGSDCWQKVMRTLTEAERTR